MHKSVLLILLSYLIIVHNPHKNGIMEELYSPDKMVEISIFSFESQLAKNDGSKVVRHSTVAAIMRSPYAPY